MKLQEFEAKQILSLYHLVIPRGIVVRTVGEAITAFKTIGKSVVLKAQIPIAGRKKAGGIRMAYTLQEVQTISGELFGSKIKDIPVTTLLVQDRVEIDQELFLGFTIDRFARKPVIIASAKGGIDFEDLARDYPEAVFSRYIDPIIGLKTYELRNLTNAIRLSKNLADEFIHFASTLYDIFISFDCELLECNPLVPTDDGKLLAVDAKMIIDDNSIFRHQQYSRKDEEMTDLEVEASERGLSFVELDGDIGIIGNGAGLVMSTLDTIAYYGGKPANFLDIGGGAKQSLVQNAIELVLEHQKAKILVLNILGGITRCDEVAYGLVRALERTKNEKPSFVRLVGTNEEEGRRILDQKGIPVLNTVDEVARAAVKKIREM